MIKSTKTIYFLLMCFAPLWVWAQTDTTVLRYSTEEVKEEQWNRKIKLKNVPGHSVMEDAPNLLFFGLATDRAIGRDFLRQGLPQEIDLSLSYERRILAYGLSVRLDLNSRLGGYSSLNTTYYSFVNNGPSVDEAEGNELLWMNVGLRYYYNKRRRILSGRSGDNLFGQYVNVNLLSTLSYFKEESRRFSVNNRLLLSKAERTFMESRPTRLGVGWGIQQRILKRLALDAGVGFVITLTEEERRWRNLFREEEYDLNVHLKIGYIILQK